MTRTEYVSAVWNLRQQIIHELHDAVSFNEVQAVIDRADIALGEFYIAHGRYDDLPSESET